MFLTQIKSNEPTISWIVAIPSNRVNVSYFWRWNQSCTLQIPCSRNPLKSGQCFLPYKSEGCTKVMIGGAVAIPSNRVNVSYARDLYPILPTRVYQNVAIPSNRVNVSYRIDKECEKKDVNRSCRNPLKSGQCFLHNQKGKHPNLFICRCRNPLKSGQCFLLILACNYPEIDAVVAIPSNRVNVSYMERRSESDWVANSVAIPSNRVNVSYKGRRGEMPLLPRRRSQSPQIGSMFPTYKRRYILSLLSRCVAIPSNRVNVSYQDVHW